MQWRPSELKSSTATSRLWDFLTRLRDYYYTTRLPRLKNQVVHMHAVHISKGCQCILGKFFVRRFYSRHISSWLNYSGEFIVRRFYISRNNRIPCLSTKIKVFFNKGIGQGLARLEWGVGQASK